MRFRSGNSSVIRAFRRLARTWRCSVMLWSPWGVPGCMPIRGLDRFVTVPSLISCLEYLRVGATLVVWRLDRLGRSLKNLIETVEELERREIGFRSLTEGLDTTTAAGRLTMLIFSGRWRSLSEIYCASGSVRALRLLASVASCSAGDPVSASRPIAPRRAY